VINALNNDGRLIGRILNAQENYLNKKAYASPLTGRNVSPRESNVEIRVEGLTMKGSPKCLKMCSKDDKPQDASTNTKIG